MNILGRQYQMVVMLFDILGETFNFITAKNKIDYANVSSLPLNTAQILYLTFLHCKESKNIYKIYFESLNEVLMVFKKAQDIHGKLLNLLDNCLIYNISCEAEITSLTSVLDNLAEIGDVLSGMNVKSMADNWKSYMNITQKYAHDFSKYLNLERPLLFFTNEIVRSINTVLELGMYDDKNITHTLKISNFILRVMVKLCDTFSEKIIVHMDIFWNFFINFYSVYSPAVKNKQFSQNTIDLLKPLICNGLEDFLNKLVQFEEFYDVQLLESLIENTDCSLGFILVTNKVLQKLVSNHNDKVTRVNIVLYLDMIFTALTKCYILFMKEDKLYAQLLISVVHLISRSSNGQFVEIEAILCKNLVAPYMWNSLFAYDTWITVCRASNIEYRFEVLVWMIENFQRNLKTHNTFRPQFTILSNFIGELFFLLSTDYKLSFIRKYSLNTNHLFIWKHIGLKYIPNSCLMLVQNHSSHMCDKMEKFTIGKCTYTDYLIMIDTMNIFASAAFDEICLDLKKLNGLFQKLWNFDTTNEKLFQSNIFKLYLENLCKLTASLMWRLCNTELIQILNQLKQICDCDSSLMLFLLVVVRVILIRSCILSQEQQTILQITSNLLRTFLTNENTIIKIPVLELIQEAPTNSPCHEALRRITGRNCHLQRLVSNFINRKGFNTINNLKTYMELEKVEFQHQCLKNIALEPLQKKKRIEITKDLPPKDAVVKNVTESIEATQVIQRIRKDVQYLGKLVGKSDLTEQNIKDVNFILKELQEYT